MDASLADMVHLTDFGGPFLIAALWTFGWRRDWLPALVPFAAVFQAPAVVTVQLGGAAFGVTPFNIASVFAAFALLQNACSARQSCVPIPARQRAIYVWWTGFLTCAALGAMVLPHLFAAVPVYPLMALSDIQPDPVPNHWSISHLAQALNSVALWVMFTWLLSEPDRERALRMFVRGLIVALIVSVALGLYQRAAMLGISELHRDFWGSNPGYNQFFLTPEYGPAVGRVGLPFAEPSYASVWFAAATAGGITALLYGDRQDRWILLAMIALGVIGLINTIGTSGLVALALFCSALAAFHGICGRRWARGGMGGNAVALALVATIGLLWLDHAWWQSAPLVPIRDVIDWTRQKFEAYATGVRLMSNRRAWEIAIETYGLGVGAGSTRASSYLLSLLANTGLAGLALFSIATVSQARAVFEMRHARPTIAWAALGALACALIGVAGGIPDQNWPILWVIVMAGFALIGTSQSQAKSS